MTGVRVPGATPDDPFGRTLMGFSDDLDVERR